MGNVKAMKRLVFVVVGAASLAPVGCHRDNQDAVQNAELNQPDAEQLNELANQAAVDNTVNPKEADEQNVSGM